MKYLLLFLLLVPTAATAQNTRIDSLKQVIETTKIDSIRGRSLCILCGELRVEGKFKEAMIAGVRGQEVSRQTKDRKGESSCLNNIGGILMTEGDYPKALEYYQKSLEIKEEIGDQPGIANTLGNLGIIYYSQGDHPRALDCYQKSLKIFEILGNKAGVSHILSSIGSVYFSQVNISRALEFYKRSLKIQEELGDPVGLSTCLNNIGNVYGSRGDLDLALVYYERSLKIAEEIGDMLSVSDNLNNIGVIYQKRGARARALDCFNRCLRIEQELGNAVGMSLIHTNIGNVYLGMGQLTTAQLHARKGLRLAQETGFMEYKRQGAQILYMTDSALGNWKAAFEAARLCHIYSDSMKNDEQSKELGRLESKAEYEKQADIDRLKREAETRAERERYFWMLGSAAIGLLLMAVIAITLFQGRRKEIRANAILRSLNEEISQQKNEIETINAELQATLTEVNEQKNEIKEQHAKIEDSIRYASRIQHAILPSETQLAQSLPAHFIHYQPRDIVSGDFYWMTKHEDKTFFATVDCTGHGVPGAFMSVLGSNLLHQIVDENQITEPDIILAELDRRIAATLRQQFGGDSKDGMDLALVVIHEADKEGKRTIGYAGAGRPLWHWSNGEIMEYKSAKYSCGGSQHEDKTYPAHCVQAQSGDRLYIFSDGPVDQFGGPKGRKLGSVQLQAFLQETAVLPIEEQGKRFGAFFNDWMKSKKQLDDVLLAGVAV